jgi:hypothetical protein
LIFWSRLRFGYCPSVMGTVSKDVFHLVHSILVLKFELTGGDLTQELLRYSYSCITLQMIELKNFEYLSSRKKHKGGVEETHTCSSGHFAKLTCTIILD